MIELGQLEGHHADFAARNVRIVAASVDSLEDSRTTASRFPHLLVLSDPDRRLVSAAGLLHAGAGPGRTDIAAPTTILVDRSGDVHWLFRPGRVLVRLSPAELLTRVDEYMPARR
jgi:peroxiredoxin